MPHPFHVLPSHTLQLPVQRKFSTLSTVSQFLHGFLPLLVPLFWNRTFGDKWHRFFYSQMPFPSPKRCRNNKKYITTTVPSTGEYHSTISWILHTQVFQIGQPTKQIVNSKLTNYTEKCFTQCDNVTSVTVIIISTDNQLNICIHTSFMATKLLQVSALKPSNLNSVNILTNNVL